MAPPSQSLTSSLQSRFPSELRAATQHDFLSRAGAGTLASAPLAAWLVQDQYYQFAYVNFIGRLISKLELSSYASGNETGAGNAKKTAAGKKEGAENLQWTTLEALVGALNAIKAEIDFYDETVRKYELDLQPAGPNEFTKQYVELFEESSAVGKPIVWGLTVLWATEFVSFVIFPTWSWFWMLCMFRHCSQLCCVFLGDALYPHDVALSKSQDDKVMIVYGCSEASSRKGRLEELPTHKTPDTSERLANIHLKCYLKAWAFAKSQSKTDAQAVQEGKGAIGALHKEFIPNWTSDDFKAAVDSLAEVTDSWASGLEKGEEDSCEKLWLKVLDLEQKFWPNE